MAKAPIKKKFFRSLTVGTIKKGKEADLIDFDGDLVGRDMFLVSLADAFWPRHLDIVPFSLDDKRYIMSPSPFLNDKKYFGESNKFLRNGPVIEFTEATEYKELQKGVLPAQLFLKALDANKTSCAVLAGYRFNPLSGDDHRTRQLSLVDIIKGAKLFSHSEDQRLMLRYDPARFYDDASLPGIKISAYDMAPHASKTKGAHLIALTPSTTSRQLRYPIKISGVAISNDALAYSIYLDHACKAKQFKDLGYARQEDIDRIYLCNHNVATILAVEDYYYRTQGNGLPTRSSFIPLPSQALVYSYVAMKNNWVIKEEKIGADNKPSCIYRKPNNAECQAVLDAVVRKVAGVRDSFVIDRYDPSGEHVLNSYCWG